MLRQVNLHMLRFCFKFKLKNYNVQGLILRSKCDWNQFSWLELNEYYFLFQNIQISIAMKAIRVHEFGGPQVLKVEHDVPVPVHTDSQVLIDTYLFNQLQFTFDFQNCFFQRFWFELDRPESTQLTLILEWDCLRNCPACPTFQAVMVLEQWKKSVRKLILSRWFNSFQWTQIGVNLFAPLSCSKPFYTLVDPYWQL